jgi:hypothetical protein
MTARQLAEEKMGLQVETVLPRSTRGRHQPAAAKPRTVALAPRLPRITRLLALAIKFQDMVDSGEVRDYADLARLGYVTRARITQVMNLLMLAPDIQERILIDISGGLSERHIRAVLKNVEWDRQRRALNPS